MKYLKKYNEIVDYNYISNYELDTITEYHGNLYLYSDIQLKLEELDDYVTCDFRNRADASDTKSEYIYQIKTKYPIYKKDFSIDIFDENSRISKEPNSGYIQKNWITNDVMCYVKKSDITSFRLIGGFAMYDKGEQLKKLDIKLSEETEDFLFSYIGGSTLNYKTLTNNIIKELEPFKEKIPIKIYKGIEEVQIKHMTVESPPYKKGQILNSNFTHLSSWSKNILIARRFVDDYPSSQPLVITRVCYPHEVLVDVTMLPKQYYHTNQREIIMKPGTYTYKILL